jgi:hypothetical protein
MKTETNEYITQLVCLMLYSGAYLVHDFAASFNNFIVYTSLIMAGTWKFSINSDEDKKKCSRKPMELEMKAEITEFSNGGI